MPLILSELSEDEKENLCMDVDFIRKRITKLRVDRDISEYKISTDLGFSKGYVQSLSLIPI